MIFTQEQTIQIAGSIEAVRTTIFYETLNKLPLISKRDAYKGFGKGKVNSWIEKGIVKPQRVGKGEKNSTFKIKFSELLMAEQSEKLSIRITNENN